MSVLDLRHSSCQADEGCIVYCRSQANILLKTPDAKLFKITTQAGKVHYVWQDAPDGYEYEFPVACRAFAEEDDLADDDIFDVKIRQEIIPDEDIFCFGGYVYYLHAKPNSNLVIYRICAYSSQKIVEQIIAEDFHDIVAENIFLSNFFLLDGKCRKYIMTCWGIVYQDGFLYMPIFDEDRHYIHERDVTAYVREEIPPGTVFMHEDKLARNGKMYYQTAVDEHGKFYLNYSNNPFNFDDKKEKKYQTENKTARIIQVNFTKSNGL